MPSIEFVCVKESEQRIAADALVLPYWKGKDLSIPAFSMSTLDSQVSACINSGDFQGKEGEICCLYTQGVEEKRIVLLGLGEKSNISIERLRRAYSALVPYASRRKWHVLSVITPFVESLTEDLTVKGIMEGILLINYTFDRYKSQEHTEDRLAFLQKICLITEHPRAASECGERLNKTFKGIYLVRDLVNGNADDITPQSLGQLAQELAENYPRLSVEVHGKEWIQSQNMGLLLAVSKGASIDPAFIILHYRANPLSKDHTVLVGKGLTYDTGGLNLKSSGMETMKCDMAGAAAILGTIMAAAELDLPLNVTGVIAATENAIGPNSYKPGDVYFSMSGKSVEITNTDAEGRLALADALSWVNKNLNPTRIIDLATLTGGVEIALGSEVAGLMCNSDSLAEDLLHSSQRTFERAWRLPLVEEYKDLLKSDIADLKNSGVRSATTIQGGLFLQEFVQDTPWAHFDIASTAFAKDAKRYLPKYATGYGVRLLLDYFEHLVKTTV